MRITPIVLPTSSSSTSAEAPGAPAQSNSTAAWKPSAKTCAYFDTGPEFVPVLLRQRDHAKAHDQTDRPRLTTSSELRLPGSVDTYLEGVSPEWSVHVNIE